MAAIFKKELKSYFSSPIGYVVVAVLLALYGFFYYVTLLYRSSSYISSMVYSNMFMWSMMIIPIITMKSMSDDKKNKTDQALLTAPVGVTSIVMGKFLAAFAVYAIAMVASLIPALIISLFATSMSWGSVLGTFFGSLFYGAAMISIGVFISSLTESQIIAAIGTFGISIFLILVDQLGTVVGGTIFQTILNWISFNARYQPFTNGTFSIPSLVFFISVVAVFVFFTARKLESKRWS